MPKLPLDEWIETIVGWMEDHLTFLFDMISGAIEGIVNAFTWVFMLPHPFLFIVILGILAFLVGRWSLALFSVIGFLLIYDLGYWSQTMDSLSLVITAALISVVVGIPIGIWCAYSKGAARIITPLLDFMQTMPAVRLFDPCRHLLQHRGRAGRHRLRHFCDSADHPPHHAGHSASVGRVDGSRGCFWFDFGPEAV